MARKRWGQRHGTRALHGRNGPAIATATGPAPYTQVGPVTLLVPQTREGGFSAGIFKRYQRSERAFVLALMGLVVHGVSTRKVSAITEEHATLASPLNGERTVRRTGTAGQRVQRTAAGR
ncbi:MAG: transposase [Dechloromonas sp.]|nr:transposase [Candidatus Dechloromonas phosphoritropha]